MTRLLLARHGRSEMNAQRRVQGWLDSPLDDVGREQARALAGRMHRENPTVIYTSPLSRARETAEIVAGLLQIKVICDERLKERSVGDVAGMTGEEIAARFPDFMRRWRDPRTFAIPPGGEEPQVFTRRVTQALAEIGARHPQETVGVVTHGGVLGVYMGYLLGIETGRWAPFSFRNGSLSVVELGDTGVRIKTVNSCCHLETEETV